MGMYVVSHKELKRRFPEKYRTIIVNANRNNVKGDLYDNTGDNISQKNGSYCELTAIYWLWKNSSDKFVGIDHYRRFFMDNKKMLTVKKAENLVKNGSVILPKKEKFNKKMSTLYWSTSGYKSDLEVINNALLKLYPEYVDDFMDFLSQKEMYCYNMFFMSRKRFDDYCKWLFSILTEVENNLNEDLNGESNRKGYYKRIYGFMAERLLNVYIKHNDIQVIEMPIMFTGKKASMSEHMINKFNKLKEKYLR